MCEMQDNGLSRRVDVNDMVSEIQRMAKSVKT